MAKGLAAKPGYAQVVELLAVEASEVVFVKLVLKNLSKEN